MGEPGDPRPTRREFLTASGALALSALCGWPARAALSPRRRRYVVSTPSHYWGKDQDLRAFKVDIDLSRRIPGNPDGRRTVFTVADDDGAGARRILSPGLFHSVVSSPKHGLIYLICDLTDGSRILTLDAETLELVSVVPASGEDRTFAGHAVLLPGGDQIALGMNHHEKGRYDVVSVRDARTLKELHAYSSYGFQLHELRLARDEKSLVCGHYGSYLGNGVYGDLASYGGYNPKDAPAAPPKYVYPASVTFVDLASGARRRLLSDVEAGQEGHADSDEKSNVYLANRRALLKTRPGLEKNPRFFEGVQTVPDDGEFAKADHGRGICVAYDPVHREVIVPKRNSMRVEVTPAGAEAARRVELSEQLPSWKDTQEPFLHGLAFHPDGRHYILSTSDGFIAVERGTHRVNPSMTFRAPLMIHTHLHVV
jgi:hypothetical protein